MKITKTDWGSVAEKYDKYLQSENNYHSEIIIPNLLRIIKGKSEIEEFKNKNILDIACGQGVFCEAMKSSEESFGKKINIFGFDAGADLVKIAQINAGKNKSNINYKVTNAEDFAKDYSETFDIVVCILALQNIENVKLVIDNIKKVTNEKSKIYFIINHPAYRIPKYTEWGYATTTVNESVQYRRVDKYMSEDKIKMDMTPSEKREAFKKFTYSFHRPLQYYFKLFSNNNLAVTRLEEWISHKNSEGKNADRENTARKEFPMFMCLEIVNV